MVAGVSGGLSRFLIKLRWSQQSIDVMRNQGFIEGPKAFPRDARSVRS